MKSIPIALAPHFFLLIASVVWTKAANTFPATGNVGIGTSTPTAQLEVANTTGQSTFRLTGNRNGQYSANILLFADELDSVRYFFNTRGTSDNPAAPFNLDYHYKTSGIDYYSVPFGVYPDALNSAGFAVGLHNNDFYVNSSGQVGMGTTAPVGSLQITRGGYAAVMLGDNNAQGWILTKETYDNSFNIWSGPFGSGPNHFKILPNGNVGIGTGNPTSLLSVNGTIHAREVIVDTSWSDFVFAKNYRLAPLSEVEKEIKSAGHLPGIPSATEVAEKGASIGEMQKLLLAKIEELTLHLIEQEKRISALEKENTALKTGVSQ